MLITLTIVFSLVIIICISLAKETGGDSIIVACICGVIIWLMLENVTTKIADPVEIPLSELSIMIDDEVAIIRYNDKNRTYDNVSEYKAIRDTSFKFMRIQEFDVFGEDNGSTYKLKINN